MFPCSSRSPSALRDFWSERPSDAVTRHGFFTIDMRPSYHVTPEQGRSWLGGRTRTPLELVSVRVASCRHAFVTSCATTRTGHLTRLLDIVAARVTLNSRGPGVASQPIGSRSRQVDVSRGDRAIPRPVRTCDQGPGRRGARGFRPHLPSPRPIPASRPAAAPRRRDTGSADQWPARSPSLHSVTMPSRLLLTRASPELVNATSSESAGCPFSSLRRAPVSMFQRVTPSVALAAASKF